jgi:hypothetical protein
LCQVRPVTTIARGHRLDASIVVRQLHHLGGCWPAPSPGHPSYRTIGIRSVYQSHHSPLSANGPSVNEL